MVGMGWDQLDPGVRAEYPWPGQDLELPNGHRLHYVDEGEGPPLLMVHGNPTWSFYYRTLVKGLSADHRCVVVDHLGCGLSDKPADYSYTIADHVDNLVALVDHLDLRDATLVVHDWGGPIGYLAALRRPDRFRRFVVFNTAAFLLPLPKSLLALRFPLYGPVFVQGLNGFLKGGFRWITGDPKRFTGAVRDGYLAPYDSWAHRRAILRFIQEIPIEQNHHNRPLLTELGDQLHTLTDKPHLIIWGKKDWIFHPGYLEEWKKRVPDAEYHEYADVSHWVVEEAHERILPLVTDFLSRHPLQG